MTSVLIKDAAGVVTLAGEGPIRGDALHFPEISDRASVSIAEGVFAEVGDALDSETVFDATGCTVVPGFVDPHTHLPFYGWRADEDAARLTGVRYEAIHSQEGGIFRSQRLLAGATDEEILTFGEDLARDMLRHGTTTFEMKSGYGMSVDAELRQLRLAAQLAERLLQRTTTTCLAAHAVPKDKSQGEWIGEAAELLLPTVVEEGLASACDLYVETIAFALEHAARLSETAKQLGLVMRVHADQLEDGQTASFAARWGFRSADHLNHTSQDAVADLAASDTAAVLLPGATFTLRQNKKPPAEDLIKAGAIVALGSDLNPGTSPILSMPFVMSLACRTYGLRPIEALIASTVNAAYVLGLDDEAGRIMLGRRADLVVLDVPSVDEITYRADHDPVLAVVCGGELVHVAERAEGRLKRSS